MGSQRVGHDLVTEHAFLDAIGRVLHWSPSLLYGEIRRFFFFFLSLKREAELAQTPLWRDTAGWTLLGMKFVFYVPQVRSDCSRVYLRLQQMDWPDAGRQEELGSIGPSLGWERRKCLQVKAEWAGSEAYRKGSVLDSSAFYPSNKQNVKVQWCFKTSSHGLMDLSLCSGKWDIKFLIILYHL